MRPPETVYRGVRVYESGRSVAAVVTLNGHALSPRRSQSVWNHSPDGFEWGYPGSGPAQLALALVLDATGAPLLALAVYQAFKGRVVATWPEAGWEITAGEVQEWVRLLLPESEGGMRCTASLRCDAPGRCARCNPDAADPRRCRVCGCTQEDCSGCVERTGLPCYWVEDDLCSACVGPDAGAAHHVDAEGGEV